MVPLLLGGCESLRVHDPGSLNTTGDVVQLSTDLSTGGANIFGPMEANLDAIEQTQTKLRNRPNDYEYKRFLAVVADYDAQELANELVASLVERKAAIGSLDASAAGVAQAVNGALDRQKTVTRILGDAIKEKSDLEKTLDRVTSLIRGPP